MSRARAAACVAIAITLALASAPAQNPITWSVSDIVGKADVSTNGELCIAANLGPEVCERAVNGVLFQADRSHWTRKRLVEGGPIVRGVRYFPSIVSGGFVLGAPHDRTAPGIGARHATDRVYDAILRDGRHSRPGTHVVTCSIAGLIPGNRYEIQLFYGSRSRPARITEWDNGVGGREGKGGIFLRAAGPHFGQVATGTFTADGTGRQTFTNYQQPADNTKNPPLKETFNACSAIQIRDISPIPLRARATYYGEGTPGTNRQQNLGGTRCSPAIALTGHPVLSSKLMLTAENSSGIASVASIVLGVARARTPVAGGVLLVVPLASLSYPMPKPASPFVHDHELRIPLTMPALPSVRALFVQTVQVDNGARGGVAFSPALEIEVGLFR